MPNAVTVTVTTSKKEEKTYDLSNNRHIATTNGYITRWSSDKSCNLAALKNLKEQLDANAENEFEDCKNQEKLQDLYQRVTKAVATLGKLNPIIIKVHKNLSKSEHDIHQPGGQKKVEDGIKRIAQHATYTTEQKIEKLKFIQTQIDEHLKTYPKLNNLEKLKTTVSNFITTLEQEEKYTPYTELLAQEFLEERDSKNPFYGDLKSAKKSLSKYSDVKTLNAYLAKPVTRKKKTGEENFRELSACFWFDFLHTNNFLDSNTNNKKLLLYIVTISQFFSHNASYYPAQGYGKAQQKECAEQLFYFRSEHKHHYVSTSRNFTGGQYGQQNVAAKNMLNAYMPEKNDEQKKQKKLVENLTEEGGWEEETKANYFGITLAHLGTRANNASFAYAMLEKIYQKHQEDNSSLTEVIPYAAQAEIKEAKKAEGIQKDLSMAIQSAQEKFQQLKRAETTADLQSQIYSSREKLAKKIVTDLATLNEDEKSCIHTTHPATSSFVVLDLYPAFMDRDTDNFKEGVTNVILGFFG
jgi:hypothetical protein